MIPEYLDYLNSLDETLRKRESVIARVMKTGEVCFPVPKSWWNPFAGKRCHMCDRGPCHGPLPLYDEWFLKT